MQGRDITPNAGTTAAPASASPSAFRVGSALPDPPFELRTADGSLAGLDIELTQMIAARLGRPWQLVPYSGSDFNGIFAGLGAGAYDCVASGTTATAARAEEADFCAPYAVSGQSLVVNARRLPQVRSIDDLSGLTIGVQSGNTSQPVAERLVAEGRAGAVKVYAYDEIGSALDDVEAGRCDSFMKLAPVMHALLQDRPALKIVQTAITCEFIALAVRKGDPLRAAIDAVQADLAADGTLDALIAKWLKAGSASVAGAHTLFSRPMIEAAFRPDHGPDPAAG